MTTQTQNISEIAKEILDVADQKYSGMSQNIWNSLYEKETKEERMSYVEIGILVYENLISTSPDESVAKPFVEQHNIKWNTEEYRRYNEAVRNNTEGELLKDSGINKNLLAIIIAFGYIIQESKLILEKLEKADGYKEGGLFLIPGITNQFVSLNKEDIDDIETVNFEQLKEVFKIRSESKFTDKTLFVNKEIEEFSRLFRSGESDKGWDYLAKRLLCTEKDIEQMYQSRNEIILGTYDHTLIDEDTDKRIDYGKLLAIRKYINYLEESDFSENTPLIKARHDRKSILDGRIILKDKETEFIERCFMLLALDERWSEAGTARMDPKEIMYLLQSNFTGFGDKVPRKKFSLPMDVTHLPYFIRLVLEGLRGLKGKKLKSQIDKRQFRNVYVDNFEGYDILDPKTVITYFNREPELFPKNSLTAKIDQLSNEILFPYR